MRDSLGQSLVETAIILPLMLMLVLNAVNFGYFFLVMVNLTGASRNGVEYAIMGQSTPAATPLPSPGPAGNTAPGNQTVTYLTQQDMTGALFNPTSAQIQVCSSASGINGTGTALTSNCVTCTGTSCGSVGTGSPVPTADPEAPTFVLNRVDIQYTFTPLIPGRIFNVALMAAPICSGNPITCTFVRSVEMRAMN